MHDTHEKESTPSFNSKVLCIAHNTFGPGGYEIISAYSDEQHISS